jgi:methionyl-tRNA formyltransferase
MVPGAWTELMGEPVKLFGPRPEPRFRHGVLGGIILEEDSEEGFLVACGSGAVRIREIQSPGKRRMPVGDWLRGHGLPEEARFE